VSVSRSKMNECSVSIQDATGAELFGGTSVEFARLADAVTAVARKRRDGGRVPVKATAADRAVADRAYAVTADELRQFVERVERLAAEIADLNDSRKLVYDEAKGRGYDTKVLRRIVALRRRDCDEVAEEEAILELYKSALGM